MKVDTLLYVLTFFQAGLIAFKVMNVIKFSWLYVLIPLWLVILFSFIGVIFAIYRITKKDNGDWYEEQNG